MQQASGTGSGTGGTGGSPYGISPEMTPYLQAQQIHQEATAATAGVPTTTSGSILVVEAASPISSRPPAGSTGIVGRNFEDMMPNSSSGGFQMEDDGVGGEETERGGGMSGGNRWPSHETNALLKIRSDMDAVFRDATLKGPLWENVSRQLAELGYIRSAKKCKEKFENVHKYYKRTKESRAGRQDGKTYRYFSQLEAIQTTPLTTTNNPTTSVMAAVPVSTNPVNPAPVSMGIGPSTGRTGTSPPMDPMMHPDAHPGLSTLAAAGISFSSNTSSSSGESEDDMEVDPSRKRKRGSGVNNQETDTTNSSAKMMSFFEGLMKQVLEKQESMQQRFLEVIEKREHDRMIREEAWKRQEVVRLNREHDMIAQERSISASRDAAIISFLQKITGQNLQLHVPLMVPGSAPSPSHSIPAPVSIPVPNPTPQVVAAPTPPQPIPPRQPPSVQTPQHHFHHHQPPQPQAQVTPPPQHHQHHHKPPTPNPEVRHHHPHSEMVVAAVPEQQHPPPPTQQQQTPPPQQEMVSASGGSTFESASSRWPKAEVIALINLRSGLESRYQEAGPKGPLWEEISMGMQRMGYNRSSKRCKEKWENINKYFKKVKESNKKRPEDAKTCPYFHQLDALYRRKAQGGSGSSSGGLFGSPEQKLESAPAALQQSVVPALQELQKTDAEGKNKNGGSGDVQSGTSGGAATTAAGTGSVAKKPEDIMKELMGHHHLQQQQQTVMNDLADEDNSDNLDEEDYEDDEDEDEEAEERSKMGYKIQFQRPNNNANGNNGTSSNGGGNGTSAAATATATAAAASSFLAMVQ